MVSAIGGARDLAVVELPEEQARRMWAPHAPVQRPEGVTFWQFMVARSLAAPRPDMHGIDVSTAEIYHRRIRKLYRVLGHDIPARVHPSRMAQQVFDVAEPDHERIYRYVNDPKHGSIVKFESDRKALIWLEAFNGRLGPAMPFYLTQTWAPTDLVNEAKASGLIAERERFLHIETEYAQLLAAHPFETNLRGTGMWRSKKTRFESYYLDAMWRTLLWIGWPLAPRPQEWATLRFRDYDRTRGVIKGWRQPKKHWKPRNVILPEEMRTWVFHAERFPTLDYYLDRVRPTTGAPAGPDDPIFVQHDGEPYSQIALSNVIRRGMRRVLGDGAPSAHALRRAGATRYWQYGWDLDEIANLLDDEKETIEQHYIDPVARDTGRVVARSDRTPRPTVPMLRPRRVAEDAEPRSRSQPPKTGLLREIPPVERSGPPLAQIIPQTGTRAANPLKEAGCTTSDDDPAEGGSVSPPSPPFDLLTQTAARGAAA